MCLGITPVPGCAPERPPTWWSSWWTGPSYRIISPITKMKGFTFFFWTNGADEEPLKSCAWELKCVFHGRLARLAQIAINKAVYDALVLRGLKGACRKARSWYLKRFMSGWCLLSIVMEVEVMDLQKPRMATLNHKVMPFLYIEGTMLNSERCDLYKYVCKSFQ